MNRIFNLAGIALSLTIFTACNSTGNKQNNDTKTEISKSENNKTMQQLNFKYNDTEHLNYVVENDESKPKPVVLIVPEWWGLADNIKNKADALAKLGYIAFAIDMYGDAKVVSTPDDAGALATPFYKNPQMSYAVFNKALEMAKTIPNADTSKIAAIGYCFGGGNLINYVRQGLKINGIVSFHGSLKSNVAAKKGNMFTPLLVLNGEADSMVPLSDRENFKKEMTDAGAQYTFIDYPNAKHAFTNPTADATAAKYKIDIAYNKEADEASWKEMLHFFNTVFSKH